MNYPPPDPEDPYAYDPDRPPPPPSPEFQQYQQYAQYQQNHPSATTILVLGILSLVCCQVLGPFAWVMGRRALKEIDSSSVPYANRGSVQAGMICGIVGSAFLILAALVFLVSGAFGFAVWNSSI